MQDTVDQAPAPPRTLTQIIKDARRAVCGHCLADSPAWACAFSGTGPDGLHLARFARAQRGGHGRRAGGGQARDGHTRSPDTRRYPSQKPADQSEGWDF